jgi:hypothetical protein
VSLKKGTEQVNATEVTVESQTKIVAKFDLTEKPLGKYDVVVENNDGGKGKLVEGFTLALTNPTITDFGIIARSEQTTIDDPKVAMNEGSIRLAISGSDFLNGTTVHLERNGKAIEGKVVSFDSSSYFLAEFDLTGVQPFTWDLIVRNPDGQIAKASEPLVILPIILLLLERFIRVLLAFQWVHGATIL